MSRPITPTPKLDKRSTASFLERIIKDETNTAKAIATPKLDDAIRKIMADAYESKK